MNAQDTLSYAAPVRRPLGGAAIAMRILSGVLLLPVAGAFLLGLLASFEYPGAQELGWKLAYGGAALASLIASSWLLFTAARALIARCTRRGMTAHSG